VLQDPHTAAADLSEGDGGALVRQAPVVPIEYERVDTGRASTTLSSMVSTSSDARLPPVRPAWLRPFASILILEVPEYRASVAFDTLVRFLKEPRIRIARGNTMIVVAGLDDSDAITQNSVTDGGADQIEAIVYQRDQPPGWAKADSGYVDRHHMLAVAVRRRRLIGFTAIHPYATRSRGGLTRSRVHRCGVCLPPSCRAPFCRAKRGGFGCEEPTRAVLRSPTARTLAAGGCRMR
jgi:hypothetical protein